MRAREEQLLFRRIPLEFVTAAAAAVVYHCCKRLTLGRRFIFTDWAEWRAVAVISAVWTLYFLHLFSGVRTKGWHQGTLCYILFIWISKLAKLWRELFCGLPMIWRTALGLLAIRRHMDGFAQRPGQGDFARPLAGRKESGGGHGALRGAYPSDQCLGEYEQRLQELDVSADDMMERFVRGDISRHTEGNGLGLSIVRSLMNLLDGRIELAVDGDLFKAILQFPVIEKPAVKQAEG